MPKASVVVALGPSQNQTQNGSAYTPGIIGSPTVTSDHNGVVSNVAVSNGNVTFTVSGGTATGTTTVVGGSKTATGSRSNNTGSGFPSSIPYGPDAQNYSGTLYPTGSVTSSTTTTPGATKTATGSQTNSTGTGFPSSIPYGPDAQNYSGTLYPSGSVTSTTVQGASKTATDYRTSSSSTATFPATVPYGPDAQNYSGTLSKSGGVYFDDVNFSPGVYRQDYSGTVSQPSTTQYTQNYSGTVSQPSTSTTTYTQNYSGTVNQPSGTVNTYTYNVTVTYNTNTPPNPPAGSIRLGWYMVGFGQVAPNGRITDTMTFDSNGVPVFSVNTLMDVSYRDIRPVMSNTSTNQAQTNSLATGIQQNSITVNAGQTYVFYIPLGQGVKTSSRLNITPNTTVNGVDTSRAGAMMNIASQPNGTNAGNRPIWGTYVDSSGAATNIDQQQNSSSYGNYIIPPGILGATNTVVQDIDIVPDPSTPSQTDLKIVFYNSGSSAETLNLRFNWHASAS